MAPLSTHGFTLIEALVTVAILAILLGLAAPSMRQLQVRWELLQAVHLLESSLGVARSEAVRRAGKIAVRKAQAHCTSTLSDLQWNCGWVVFHDVDGDGQQSDTEEALQTVDLAGHLQVQASFSEGVLRWNRYGGIQDGGSQNFTVTYPGLASVARVLCVHQTGRIRLQESATCT